MQYDVIGYSPPKEDRFGSAHANQSNIDLAAPYTDVLLLKQHRLEDFSFKSIQNCHLTATTPAP